METLIEQQSISLDDADKTINLENTVENLTTSCTNQSVVKGEAEVKDVDVEAKAEAPLPARPHYSVFSKKMKVLIVFMTSLGSLFSPLSSTIYLPALNTIASDLHKTVANINLTVTSYMVFQGVAPMFFGSIGDVIGRRPVYIVAFTVYFFANLGLALQNNYAALFVLRAMQSTGSSGTIALGQGVMSDIVTSAERGQYIAWVTAGALLGPAFAPTIGGLLAEFLGWHSIFWFLVIAGGLYLTAYLIFVPETARNVVGDGSLPGMKWSRPLIYYFQRRETGLEREKIEESEELRKSRSIQAANPFNVLRIIFEKDVATILFFTALLVTTFQCVLVVLPTQFSAIYGLSDFKIGLCYMPFSAGTIAGTLLIGKVQNWNYARVARSIGVTVDRKRGEDLRKFPIEKARLQVVWVPVILGQLSVIAWGWVLETRTTLAAALIIITLVGLCSTAVMSALSTLLVDLYPQSPSTATASQNLTRCLMSAAGTAVVQYIIDAWGAGWTFTFLGLITIAALPILLVDQKWGPKWREERHLRLKAESEKRALRKAVKEKAKKVSQNRLEKIQP